ncbi:histidine kinase [Gallibacterium salpingitidis]|uniref:histidine kinase n=1 Tax=Gallibacterium salpingitidis TaxID=505341 RepID=A0AB36E0F7_9PAST|nr:envelope stress sensor histidine kinase CpxA [Gallibacterium salpingitidis]OBX07996.1 histidine kinase [Gallibacterium salpingitidis]WKS99095.1 envelope stress sensor histidine kinase CpxA [Gallibacterium salpingitidis]
MKKSIIKLFSSLTGQIYLFFILVFCISFIIVVFLPSFDARNYSILNDKEINYYNNIVFAMMEKTDANNIFELQSQVEFIEKEKKLRFALVNQAGKILNVNYQDYTNIKEFISRSNNPLYPQEKQFDNSEIVGPFLIKLSDGSDKLSIYYVYFIKNVPPTHPFIKKFFDNYLIMLLVIIVMTAPLLLILSYRITKPIVKLRKAVNNVAMGNFTINPDLEKEGPIEIRAVGKNFNQMVAALENLLTSQKRMLSDISHELRTPLARLKLSAAIIRRRHGETPELARIEIEAERLEQMISDILNISRQQISHHFAHKISPINDIWEDVIENTHFELEQLNKAQNTNKHLIVENNIAHPERYFINGNISALAGALENIIQNAKKYGEQTIKLSFSIVDDYLNISIEDDGNGIDDSEYKNIFEPFYRVDTARTRESGGFGLGLAIVLNTVKQHHGTIEAQRSELGGLLVKMQLPLWFD